MSLSLLKISLGLSRSKTQRLKTTGFEAAARYFWRSTRENLTGTVEQFGTTPTNRPTFQIQAWLFQVLAGATATVRGLESSGNEGSGLGLSSLDGASTHASDLEIIGNTSFGSGGSGGDGAGIKIISNSGGTTLVENSTISRNQVVRLNSNREAFGGGIFVESVSGDTILRQLTVEGNTAMDSGGGIFINSDQPATSSFRIENSTIVGNTSGVRPLNVAQGGGVATNRPVTITNSIIAGNTDGGGLPNDLLGIVGAGGFEIEHSLIGDNVGTTLVEASPDASGNIIGGSINGTIDPDLGPLARNGRDRLTLLPNSSSPAVNAGDPTFTSLDGDQRGVAFERVVGGRLDIGAVERESTLIVDIVADESDGNVSVGDLSLREAIEIANSMSGSQRIEFADSVAGSTFALNAGQQLDVTDDVTIAGSELASVTVDGGNASRIFNVSNPNQDIDVTLSRLVLENGASNIGGAVFSDENLNIVDSTLRNNRATSGGAIAIDDGNLSLRRVELLNNVATFGGGLSLLSGSSALVEQSTFRDNNATQTGGAVIASGASAEIRDSALAKNSADRGGAIFLFSLSELLLFQSTVSGNTSLSNGGGIEIIGYSSADVRHSTIVRNTADSDANGAGDGGGIFSQGSLQLSHTIVAENLTDSVAGSNLETDGDIRVDFSLIGSATGSGLAEANPVADENGNLIGGVATGVIDTQLGPLGDFGGPTEVHGLPASSPAVDAGNFLLDDLQRADQRGVPFERIQNGRIDIGAFEAQEVPTTLIVDILDDELDSDLSLGDLSLREAVREANLGFGNTVIMFSPALNGGTITLDMGELRVTAGVEIRGPGAALLTISGDSSTRLFHIDDGSAFDSNVGIWDLTLTDGQQLAGDGGAILSREDLDLRRLQVLNSAAVNGGGVASVEGSLSISDSTFAGNTANGNGGAIYGDTFLPVSVRQSTISQNTASADGGGLWASSAVTINRSTVTLNTAGNAGGVFSAKGLLIDDSIVAANEATTTGEDDISGSLVSARFNFIGNNVGSGLAESSLDADGNQVGGAAGGNLDPQLLPLDDNGGSTMTHLPASGSPVIDAGSSFSSPSFDQRGEPFLRVNGGRIDIGSVETEVNGFGDFNFDGEFDCSDINALTTAIANGSSQALFDVNQDGVVSYDDVLEWLEIAGNANVGGAYILGDINLDGFVDVSDFGVYNSNVFTANSNWCDGDITADGSVDVSDFNVWNEHIFMSSFPVVNTNTTPDLGTPNLEASDSAGDTQSSVASLNFGNLDTAVSDMAHQQVEARVWQQPSLDSHDVREERVKESAVAEVFASFDDVGLGGL